MIRGSIARRQGMTTARLCILSARFRRNATVALLAHGSQAIAPKPLRAA
jgi:hypothetical protein